MQLSQFAWWSFSPMFTARELIFISLKISSGPPVTGPPADMEVSQPRSPTKTPPKLPSSRALSGTAW